MAHFRDRSPAESHVVLLGDHDTVRRHRDDLSAHAAQHGCAIADSFSFSPGEAAAREDLTEVDAVMSALGRAIAGRMDVWVPFAGPDLGREQHWRRMSLVLQRHGLNLRVGRELESCPIDGGFSEVDVALRHEVRAVDDLDHAALAAVGVETLWREMELAFVAAGSPASCAPPPLRRLTGGTGTDAGPCAENSAPPMLPAPTEPWARRRPVLKRYVRWLVEGCGVTQAATARVLNSTGQRTPKGRPWQPATVSALLNGRYDHGAAV